MTASSERWASGAWLTRPLMTFVAVAMIVTYLGNRHWTWRGRSADKQHREVALFVFFNLVGMGIAVACLGISHYLFGFDSPLADNIAANGFGLVLGTAFRFWAYRTHVFREDRQPVG